MPNLKPQTSNLKPQTSNLKPHDLPISFYGSGILTPTTLTIITTYTCNAACKECCFECSPKVKARLSYEEIHNSILNAYKSFGKLKLVVFTGGECFLLKDELYKAIAFANSLGLITRCVTNAFWGRTKKLADESVAKLIKAGISEINISTGVDHQKWVTAKSVKRAALTLINSKIITLITVEKDTEDSNCLNSFINDSIFRKALNENYQLFKIQSNSWMPFHADAETRGDQSKHVNLKNGCGQLFNNTVVTPHNELSACCGLTLEHIPEMKLGKLKNENLSDTYFSQFSDFLKIWISVDGPLNIIEKVMGKDFVTNNLQMASHECQVCAFLHKNEEVKRKLTAAYPAHVKIVLAQFGLKKVIEKDQERKLAKMERKEINYEKA